MQVNIHICIRSLAQSFFLESGKLAHAFPHLVPLCTVQLLCNARTITGIDLDVLMLCALLRGQPAGALALGYQIHSYKCA